MAVDINITPIIREVTIEIGQGGGAAVWGSISGTLADQTDLALEQTAQDTLISTNATDIGTNVTGILALDTSQGVQDTAIGLNTAKVTFPEAPNDGTQYARKDLGWEAVAGGSSPILTAYKTADESKVNDTTRTLDSELFVTLEANSYYYVELSIIANSDSAYDIRIDFQTGIVTTATIMWYTDSDSLAGTVLTNYSQQTIPGSGANKALNINANIYTTDAGVYGINWAQFVSGAIPSTFLKGSSMIATKLN